MYQLINKSTKTRKWNSLKHRCSRGQMGMLFYFWDFQSLVPCKNIRIIPTAMKCTSGPFKCSENTNFQVKCNYLQYLIRTKGYSSAGCVYIAVMPIQQHCYQEAKHPAEYKAQLGSVAPLMSSSMEWALTAYSLI